MNSETLLISAITVLSGVIGILWGTVRSHVKGIETRLRECEVDRDELWDRLCRIEARTDSIERKNGAKE